MSQEAVVPTVTINDVVAFFVEVGALVALGVWAWRSAPGPGITRALAVVLVIAATAVLWGLFVAPKATFDEPVVAIGVRVLVLGGSVLAAYTMVPMWVATCWATLVVINTALVGVVRLT